MKRKKQAELEQLIIEQYIEEQDLRAEAGEEGLHYVVEEQGTGKWAKDHSKVTVHYTGYLMNGDVFDTSQGRKPIMASLKQVIRGWRLGIPKFREGGKGKLIIPSTLGYGGKAQAGIPKHSVLIFDIELIKVR